MIPTPRSRPAPPSRRCTIRPWRASRSRSSGARPAAWQARPSETQALHQRENEQRIAGRDEVVEQRAEAALPAPLDPADGRRLADVEAAEEDEARNLPLEAARKQRG